MKSFLFLVPLVILSGCSSLPVKATKQISGPRLSAPIIQNDSLTSNGQFGTMTRIGWDLAGVPSATVAQTYEIRTALDAVRPTTPVLMQGISCVPSTPAVANQVTCQGGFPVSLMNSVNIVGKHTLVFRLFDPSTQLESGDSLPLTLLTAPSAPFNIVIVVQ